ncbi:hypothetical protein FJY94_06325 [Candidatus Kaiserbacteria bacterium]|nr:hypothetical protein [Candidatus Kaiserbacteria bacterium]
MAEIARTSPTHDQIALWLVENPGPRQTSRCAEYFGYTVAWMSTIINSDAFRARLAQVQEHCDAAVANDIPAKLRGVASLALDGLAEQLADAAQAPSIVHREFMRETADMALHRLGFAPAKGPSGPTHIGQLNVQNNLLPVDPEALARARERLSAPGAQFSSLTAASASGVDHPRSLPPIEVLPAA